MPCSRRMLACRNGCLHRLFVEDYQLAVEAQQLRAEAASNGYATELSEYYRDTEPKLTFKQWLIQGTQWRSE